MLVKDQRITTMSDRLSIGERAPDFTLPANHGVTVALNAYRGHRVVVYFYPKDDTSGCTKQAIGFSQLLPEFIKLGVHVIGISKDPITKHNKFIEKHDLKITLASDVEGTVIEDYGVWVEKNMYGRKYFGIERATYLINSSGIIVKIWRKVRVAGHVEAVLNECQLMSSS